MKKYTLTMINKERDDFPMWGTATNMYAGLDGTDDPTRYPPHPTFYKLLNLLWHRVGLQIEPVWKNGRFWYYDTRPYPDFGTCTVVGCVHPRTRINGKIQPCQFKSPWFDIRNPVNEP